MKQDQLYFYDYKFECKMRKFSNSMVCEVHSEELKFVEARCPPRSFYIMKREELEEWFCCLSRENRIIGNYCDSSVTLKWLFCCQRLALATNYLGDS